MSQILKAYFFCTFLRYNLYFFSQFFVLFLGDEPVATLIQEGGDLILLRDGTWLQIKNPVQIIISVNSKGGKSTESRYN